MPGWLTALGSGWSNMMSNPFVQGIGSLFGFNQSSKYFDQGRKDIQNLPGMNPINMMGAFGGASGATGKSAISPELQAMMGAAGGFAPALMGGGMFNMNPALQQAMQGMDFGGAMNQADAATQVQMGPNAFGGMQNLWNQGGNMFNQMAGNVAAGPQDISGGLQGQLFNQAQANLGSFGDTQSAELAAMRAAAAPQQQRAQNQLFNRAQAMGMGLPSTGEMIRSQQTAFDEADLNFQTASFDRAMGRQNLGLAQSQAGAGLQQQGFNQWNQNFQNAMGAGQFMQGIEGQQFGQNLQSAGFNTSQGQQRLQNMQNLFGFGQDVFGQNVNLGLGMGNLGLGIGQFGLDVAMAPYLAQSGLLQAGGQHADALSQIARAQAEASGSFFGSLFSDRRLKDNLQFIEEDNAGNKWYTWEWNSQAKLVGAHHQPSWGVIAQEVEEYFPEAVIDGPGGFKMVDYGALPNGS